MKDFIPFASDVELSLSALPGVDRWGARRIERAVNVDTAGGALIGVLISPLLLLSARVLASAARQAWGWPWGHVGWLVGWALSGWLALVLLANWRTLDEADGES